MASRAIQYRGRRAILKAFDLTEIAAWSCILGEKQIVARSAGKSIDESREDLERFLKEMEQSNTVSQYTLNFYEGLKDRTKIRLSLEPTISYNVQLWDHEDNPSPSSTGRREGTNMILDRMDQLEAKIALLKGADEEGDDQVEEEKPMGALDRIAGIFDRLLDNPKVQEHIGLKVVGWMDNFFTPATHLPMQTETIHAAAMGNTGSPGEMPQITQDQADKIHSALTVLAGVDPQLGDHLLKIAEVAQQKPKKYQTLIGMLNTFL